MVTFNWRIMLGHGLNHLELSVHPTIQTVSCGKKTKDFTQKSQTVKTWVVGSRNSMNSLPLKTVSVFPRVFSSLFPVFFWKKNDSYFWGFKGSIQLQSPTMNAGGRYIPRLLPPPPPQVQQWLWQELRRQVPPLSVQRLSVQRLWHQEQAQVSEPGLLRRFLLFLWLEYTFCCSQRC